MTTATSDGGQEESNVIDWNKFSGKGGGKRERRVRGDATVQDPVVSRDSDPVRRAIESGADPDKFYLASADSKGHQYQIKNVNVPQGLGAAIAEVREYFPEYRSAQDFVRDAIMHRLMYLRDRIDSGELTELMVIEQMRAKVEYNRLMMGQAKSTYEETVSACVQALEVKDYRRLDKVLQTIDDLFHELDDRDPYLRAYVELFKKYGAEMKRARDSGAYADGPVVQAVDWNQMRGSGMKD